MPTYPYRCRTCDHEFEEFQSMSDEPLTVCPECGGEIHRIISGGAGLIFKGSGFYITDYRKDSYSKDAARDKSESSSSVGTEKTKKTETSKSDSTKKSGGD
jgi:putative FmdB family regulatory protein